MPVEANIPQHPDQQQESMSFDQSRSTAQYLRAHGPDIHLIVDMVFGGQVDNTSNSSSSSSSGASVTSANEASLVAPAQFGVGYRLIVPLMYMYTSYAYVPMPLSLKGRWNVAFKQHDDECNSLQEDLSKAIVPYRPSLHVFVLQLLAQKMDEVANQLEHDTQNRDLSQELSDIATDVMVTETTSSLVYSQLQLSMNVVDPVLANKCLLSSFDNVGTISGAPPISLPPRPTKKKNAIAYYYLGLLFYHPNGDVTS